MLKREQRLSKKNDFDRVFKSGKSSFNKLVGVKALKNELEANRYGVIVSNKISKKAVERNKIKRRIREIINKEAEKISLGVDVVILTLPEIREKSFEEIESAVKAGFNKLRLYKQILK